MRWNHIPRSPGVYQISTPSGKFYFGKSNNMQLRCQAHYSYLKRNKHANYRIQSAFNKYGEQKIKFKVLQQCDMDSIHYLEAYYISLFQSDPNCMNVVGPTKNREDYGQRLISKKAYCAVYWSRQIYAVDSMGSWAYELGKCNTFRGLRYKMWIFDAKEKAEKWIKECDRACIMDEIKDINKNQNKVSERLIAEKEKFYKWSFHVKHESGRASIARNTYELKQFKVSDGWIHRRKGEPWPEQKTGTPSKPVYGWHPIYGFQQWNSIGACARSLSRSTMPIHKALNGAQKTSAGWHLSHAPITDPNGAKSHH